MIDKALIIPGGFSGTDLQPENALRVVLGQPVICRVILAAGQVGIREFVIPVQEKDSRIEQTVSSNRLIRQKGYNCIFPVVGELSDTAKLKKEFKHPVLLLSDNRLIDRGTLQMAVDANPGKSHSMLLLDPNAAADGDYELEVKLGSKGQLSQVGPDLRTIDGAWTGTGIVAAARIPELFERLKKRKKKELTVTDFKALFKESKILETESCKYSIPVENQESVPFIVKRLLNSVRKDTDGFVSRNFNRYVSLWFSKWFLKWHIRPNVISFTNFALGLLSAFLITIGSYPATLVSGLLFQFTSIIDGSDGEVAKLGFMATEKGAWIDTVCDQLTYLLFFIALPIGVYRGSALQATPVTGTWTVQPFATEASSLQYNNLYLWLTFGILAGMGLVYLLMIRFVRRQGGEGSMLKILDQIYLWAKQPGLKNLPHKLAAGVSFAVRRDFFAFAVMVLCIAGFPAAVLWALSAVLLGSMVYLSVYFR